jgi:hypothetical protein
MNVLSFLNPVFFIFTPAYLLSCTLVLYWGRRLWNFALSSLCMVVLTAAILNPFLRFRDRMAPLYTLIDKIDITPRFKCCFPRGPKEEGLFNMPADLNPNARTSVWESLHSPRDILDSLVRWTHGLLTLDQARDCVFEPKQALLAFLSSYVDLANLLDKIQELGEVESVNKALVRALTESAEGLIAHSQGIRFVAFLCAGMRIMALRNSYYP